MILSKDNFCIEKSKDGFNILRIEKENKKMYIGSKYRMKEQIDKFIENIKKEVKDDSVFVIFGIGSGECLKQLKKVYSENKIIIFEPNVNLIDYIVKNSKEYSLLQDKNVYLINSKEDNLISTFKSIIQDYELRKIVYRCLLNYDKIYIKEFLEFNKVLKDVVSDKVISRNTNMLFAETWFDTLINNLEHIIKASPIDIYKDKYKNIPAIIVSAGPSLSKNIEHLKNINNDILILTGGRTLKPLLERDIIPNLLGVVDPGEASYELVDGYIDKYKIPMLFYEGTNKDVVDYHKGKKLIFTQSNLIRKIFNLNITNLALGGSISHTLTAAALLMGCNPIIFIGQDLAYTEEKFHADIAINQFINVEDNNVKKETSLYVEDIEGNKIKTDEILNSFKRELEEIIRKNSHVKFIDATEGGAKIKGTSLMKLENVIKEYRDNKSIKLLSENDVIDYKLNLQKSIKLLKETIDACKFIKIQCKKGLEVLNDLYIYNKCNNISKINKDLKVLDQIDKNIKIKCNKIEILNNLIYPTVYAILSDSKANNDDDIIEKNKFLYKSILEKMEFSLKPIEKVLNKLINKI